MVCIEMRPAQLIACTCIGMSELFFLLFFFHRLLLTLKTHVRTFYTILYVLILGIQTFGFLVMNPPNVWKKLSKMTQMTLFSPLPSFHFLFFWNNFSDSITAYFFLPNMFY